MTGATMLPLVVATGDVPAVTYEIRAGGDGRLTRIAP